jgi:uncharacterized protein (TIGR02996 family)
VIDIYQTDEWRALLRSICEVPHDDLPRLVAADWLDEHERSVPCIYCDGRGWHYNDRGGNIGVQSHCEACNGAGYVSNGYADCAEFIRLQVEIARIDAPTLSEIKSGAYPDHKELRLRERALWTIPTIDINAWYPGIDGLAYSPELHNISFSGVSGLVSRGFVGSIRLTSEQFEQHATELFTQHPITEMVLCGRKPFRDGANHSQTWWWSPPTTGRTAENYLDVLPQKIIDRIRKKFGVGAPYDPGFTSYELAMKALSDVCVSIGRELAKLPPLDAV